MILVLTKCDQIVNTSSTMLAGKNTLKTLKLLLGSSQQWWA